MCFSKFLVDLTTVFQNGGSPCSLPLHFEQAKGVVVMTRDDLIGVHPMRTRLDVNIA